MISIIIILYHPLPLLVLLVAPAYTVAQTSNITLGSNLVASNEISSSSSWKSPSGDFAFGFRRLENQELFLLAIWFDRIPEKTTVWYANGDNPVPVGSKVELTADGQLALSDSRGSIIWMAENVVSGRVSYAAMLDTGNFVLADKDSNSVWESFGYPTDTILPTQVLELGGMLSSKQTESNYSKSRFQLRLEPDGNLVLSTIALPTGNAYNTYYESHTDDSSNSSNSGFRLVFNESGYLYIVRRNGNMVNLTSGTIVFLRDYYYRATLDFDGLFVQYAYPKPQRNGSTNQSWSVVWSVPDDICSATTGEQGLGSCGFNSYCLLGSNGRPSCECIPGFSFSDSNNKFNGCKQDRIQECEGRPEDLYDMQALSNIFWPTSSNFEIRPSNEDDCSRSCLYDCNCVVAVLREGSCNTKKLPVTNGQFDREINGKAFVKVVKSDVLFKNPDVQNKDQSTLILVGSILLSGSALLNFLLITVVLLVITHFRRKRPKLAKLPSIIQQSVRTYTYEDLKKATDGFREELGRGAFGVVFKGVLNTSGSRNLVAVKMLDNVLQEGEKEFKAEVGAIAKTHHKNLVRLTGFCDEGPHKLLVYEFMSNGTLANFLFGNSRPDWNKRIQMALGIARGLVYLHEECDTQIIHCDIKPENILLDDSFTPRISDFGLAKLLNSEQSRTLTAIRGTKGYVAPEWFRNMPISVKVDVYSYGVMLLEIVCCRKSVEMGRKNEEELALTDWANDCYMEGKLHKLVENDEEARNDKVMLERLAMVAIWCIQEDPFLRPSMKNVSLMLEGILDVSVPPCPVPFSSIC